MDARFNQISSSTATPHDPRKYAQALGRLLLHTREYDTFLEALRKVNNDLAVQRLAAQIRSRRSAIQWGADGSGQQAAELAQLERELEALPEVKEYRRAEEAVHSLFSAVDAIVSQEAGIAFAANAKRSSCCG